VKRQSVSFADLADALRDRFARLATTYSDDPSFPAPLPRGSRFDELLETCLWASLERDEGRPTSFCVSLYKKTQALPELRIPISPRPLSRDVLRKLAQVSNAADASIVVKEFDDGLKVVGIVDWWPDIQPMIELPIEIISRKSGALSVEYGPFRVGFIEAGNLEAPGPALFRINGPVQKALGTLTRGTAYSVSHFTVTLCEILEGIQAHGHGGLVFLKRTKPDGAEPLRWRVAGKALSLFKSSDEKKKVQQEEMRAENFNVYRAINRERGMDAMQRRQVALVVALSSMDGAVWLDEQLRPRAFGVFMQSSAQPRVLHASDAEAKASRPIKLQHVGARHRAAVSFAYCNPGSLAFAVSADGGYAACLRPLNRRSVTLWKFTSRAFQMKDVFDSSYNQQVAALVAEIAQR